MTPNIREKILWNPTAHAWIVYIKHPKQPIPADKYAADPNESVEEYEAQNNAAYWRAVEAWNTLDGTKRHPIPVSSFAQ